MPIVGIDGTRIHYWMGKNGPSPGRPAILFIHGAGGSQFTWGCQKVFFEKEFSPIIIELPGHGDSGGEGEEDIGRYAGQVYAFLQTMGLGKIFLVGHSMGGAIVQTLALAHPGSFEGIVLVGTGARLKVVPMILDGIQNHFEETVRRITQFAYSRKAPSELVEQGVSQLLKSRPEVLYGDFLACDRFDFMNEVKRIALPALVLCGSEDELTPVKYSRYLHGEIKGARMEILSNAGHMVMMESPGVFNERVRDFIWEVRSKGAGEGI